MPIGGSTELHVANVPLCCFENSSDHHQQKLITLHEHFCMLVCILYSTEVVLTAAQFRSAVNQSSYDDDDDDFFSPDDPELYLFKLETTGS